MMWLVDIGKWVVKYRRLIAYAGVALVALWFLLLVRHWRADSLELPQVQSALQLEVDCAEGSVCWDRSEKLKAAALEASREVVETYEQEMADLRNRPVPTRVIRVCKPTDDGGLRHAASAEGTAGPAGAESLQQFDEFDTRPLRELAATADQINAAYRALYTRDQALSKPPPAGE